MTTEVYYTMDEEKESDEEDVGMGCMWCGRRPFMGKFLRDDTCQKNSCPMENNDEDLEYEHIFERNNRIVNIFKTVMTQLKNR